MNILTRYQNYILIAVVVIASIAVYMYYFGGEDEPILEQQAVAGVDNPIDQELIALLLELKGITLDESIFSNPVFSSLSDFSQALVPEPVGRINPFAPYGAGAP